MLSAARDADATERFFQKVLEACHITTPRVNTVDQHAAYPLAFEALQQARLLCATRPLRQCKYLNDVIDQDNRFVKRRINSGLGAGTFSTAQRTVQGYEAMHMFRKGQLERDTKGDVLAQNPIINQLFG
jgi:IS6 family transposase